MSEIEKHDLPPGNDLDPAASLDAYLATVPVRYADHFEPLVKIVADRAMEVAYPFLLKAARETRGGPVRMEDGWTYASADTGNPWRPALFVGRPDGSGYLCAFEIDVDVPPAALAAFDPSFPVKEDEGFDLDTFFARMDAERRLVERGVVAGMPDPDSVAEVDRVSVHAVRPAGAPLTSLGNLYPRTLAETVAGAASDTYCGGRILRTKADGIGSKTSYDGEIMLTAGVLDALEPLGRVAAHVAAPRALAARNAEVGARRVTTLSTKGWERALLEAGIAAVHRDGGVVGSTTRDVMTRTWLHGVCAGLGRHVEELGQAQQILEARGHVADGDRYDCNDGRTGMWVAEGPDGGTDAFVRSQGSTCVSRRVEDADGTVVTMARLGDWRVPIDDPVVAAATDLDSPGFLGRYRVHADGTATVLDAPAFSDLAVMNLNDTVLNVSSVACCAEEEYGAAAPAP